MAYVAGALSVTSYSQTVATVVSAVATGGTGPYTYQWYRSTTTGFTPGPSNIIAGATALTLNDTGLIPGTQYYYKVVATDTGNANTTVTSTQLGVLTTNVVPTPNQFAMSTTLGMLDMPFNYGTISAIIDPAFTGTAFAGQPVKLVAGTSGGAPKVTPCTLASDPVFGYINYNIKNIGFVANQSVELSQSGNMMYLYATAAITQGARVMVDIATVGGVVAYSAGGGQAIVGWAFDGAAGAGALIRVRLDAVPTFVFA